MPVISKQKQKKPKKRKREMSAVDRIGPISFDDDGVKIALYGQSGSGKTTLWATFPKPILAIVCSGGKKSGELRSISKADRKVIKSVVLRESGEITELLEYQANANKFATVVLDHASGLQDLSLCEIIGLKSMPEQSSWGLASREQYGQCALQVKTHLRQFLELDCNVVIVAQEREFNTDNDSEIIMPTVGAALMPSITGWLNAAVDYIGQTFIQAKVKRKMVTLDGDRVEQVTKIRGEVDYCLRTGPDEVYTTKFRIPKGEHNVRAVMLDPSYKKINKLIQGG